MDIKKYSMGCIVLISIVGLCGCTNQGTTTEKTFENIIFESDVVELAAANMEYIQEEMHDENSTPYNVTKALEVRFLLQNKLKRSIIVNVYIEFYNNDDVKLHSIGPREIHLIKEYTEQTYTPVNIATYDGNNIEDVDYVKIIAFENLNQ